MNVKVKKVWIIAGSLIILLLAVGVVGAIPAWSPASPQAAAATVSSGISYQGRLTTPGGVPLNGTYTMRFIVYDDAVAGSAMWDSGNMNITVENGLFAVKLNVDQADMNGQALWVSIIVDGQTLSPRQEILPAPYALSLRPGADIVGDAIAANDATLAGYAPATGTALYADAAGGVGVFGDSENNYGVQGSSDNSWGGYFTSANGYGLRVNTDGTDHYDHGAYITSQGGYAILARSANNMGVRGEAGDITGVPHPLGSIGVVGLGLSRGVVGSSNTGSGVFASSIGNYGVWGQSTNYRGIIGLTSRADSNWGLYTLDNLYSANINFAGSIMQVMQNTGNTPLSPGDVAAFNGIDRAATAVDGPMVQVSRATAANSAAVAGVVFSRFNIDAIDPALESPDGSAGIDPAALEVTPAGDAAPGDYVLVVIYGPAQVRVDALSGRNIQPGDLLSVGGAAGLAGRAATITVDGRETAVPGTVFGKALEAYDGTQEMIYVYVTSR